MKAQPAWVKRAALLLLLVIAGVALWQAKSLDIAATVEQIGALGPLAWIAFILFYALATVLFLPGSVLTLAGGSLFGPILGTFVNLTGATLGATLAFLISRYFASNWVEQKSGGRLKQIKQGVESEGWRFVAFVRLVPLFPFNLLNYALGLTRIRLSHYIIASYLCMLPGGFAYTYLGYAGREAATGGEGLIQKGLMALALLAVVAFVPRLVSRLRQGDTLDIETLDQQLKSEAEWLLLDVRSAADYEGELSHIEGAVNIPLEELESRLTELQEQQEKPIALICTTDRRSAKAARLLTQQGFSEVHLVLGGMKQWNSEGRPIA